MVRGSQLTGSGQISFFAPTDTYPDVRRILDQAPDFKFSLDTSMFFN